MIFCGVVLCAELGEVTKVHTGDSCDLHEHCSTGTKTFAFQVLSPRKPATNHQCLGRGDGPWLKLCVRPQQGTLIVLSTPPADSWCNQGVAKPVTRQEKGNIYPKPFKKATTHQRYQALSVRASLLCLYFQYTPTKAKTAFEGKAFIAEFSAISPSFCIVVVQEALEKALDLWPV